MNVSYNFMHCMNRIDAIIDNISNGQDGDAAKIILIQSVSLGDCLVPGLFHITSIS